MAYQPTDGAGRLIVPHAMITQYLGSSGDTDRYLLELPAGTAHQTGPYTMWRETPPKKADQ